jgi:hypothetical protein
MDEPVFNFGERIHFGGKIVGCYARTLKGNRVVVLWKVYHEYQDSYSTSVRLLEKIDDEVDHLYMYDKNKKELFKFQRSTYEKAPTNHHEQAQKSPHVAHNIGHWQNGEEIVENFSMVN